MGITYSMASKAAKIAPLFFILLIAFSATTFMPAAMTGNLATATPQVNADRAPLTPGPWINSSSAYADYNGHIGESISNYTFTSGIQAGYIVTASLTNSPNSAHTYSNVTVIPREFFTNATMSQLKGIWFNISIATGNVIQWSGGSGSNSYPMFLYVPAVKDLKIGDTVLILTPFNIVPQTFTANHTETILGVSTTELVASWNITTPETGAPAYTIEYIGAADLWISNDSNALMMRMIGHESDYMYNTDDLSIWFDHQTQMSFEIAYPLTNIMTLVLKSIPSSVVGWMSPGKYIQYNLQGSGYIAASINLHNGTTWALPGNTQFRATVSANVTLKVTRGASAWVDPWNTTIYAWVVHVMVNNTQLLLPDLDRTIKYFNQTLKLSVDYPQAVTEIESMFSPFNHTGLVADTWFLVDNATGTMLWPGVNLGALSTISSLNASIITSSLGSLLSKGLGLQILSYFAQSILYQGWTVSNPVSTQSLGFTSEGPDYAYTQTTSISAHASITDVGTTYLKFPGGGGGHCWQLQPSVNVQITESTILNRTAVTLPYGSAFDYLMNNGTFSLTSGSNSYMDIERTTGFPVGMDLALNFTYSGQAQQSPFWDMSAGLTVFVDLSMSVPKTNIWFSNPPVTLIVFGGNVTTPPGYFGQYGFDVWMSGASNVTVTSSVSPPPDANATVPGTLPFCYLDVKGIPTGGAGSAIILYVYYNRTKVTLLGLNENGLKLYVWNTSNSTWSALQTTHLVINSTTGVLFAVLPHLSYFAVLGSAPTGGGGAIPSTDILIVAVVVIVALAAVVLTRRRRGGVK
jgi:hypothetical protein